MTEAPPAQPEPIDYELVGVRYGAPRGAALDRYRDPQSNFNRYNAADEDIQGVTRTSAFLHTVGNLWAGSPPSPFLTPAQLETLREGSAIYNLWLNPVVRGSRGQEIELDSSEFMAWRRDGAHLPVDVWAEQNNIQIISQKERLPEVGGLQVNVEWHEGTRNIRGGWRALVSEERQGHYGEFTILGPDGRAVTNADGQPDLFMTDAVYQGIRNGTPYRGPVVIRDGADLEFFMGTETVEASRNLAASGFAPTTDRDGNPITGRQAFENYDRGATYHTVSYAQFQAWQHSVAADPNQYYNHETGQAKTFNQWVIDNWGSRERFDGIFNGMTEISRERYEQIVDIANGADNIMGTSDDLAVDDVRSQAGLPSLHHSGDLALF